MSIIMLNYLSRLNSELAMLKVNPQKLTILRHWFDEQISGAEYLHGF